VQLSLSLDASFRAATNRTSACIGLDQCTCDMLLFVRPAAVRTLANSSCPLTILSPAPKVLLSTAEATTPEPEVRRRRCPAKQVKLADSSRRAGTAATAPSLDATERQSRHHKHICQQNTSRSAPRSVVTTVRHDDDDVVVCGGKSTRHALRQQSCSHDTASKPPTARNPGRPPAPRIFSQPYLAPSWRGISRWRSESDSAVASLRIAALDCAVAANGTMAMALAARTVEPRFHPSPRAAAAIVDYAVAQAPLELKASVAVEAMARVREALGVCSSVPMLASVASAASTDPEVSSRAARAFSVLRTMRGDRMMPSTDLLKACFSACVAALDVSAAYAIMNFARSAGFFLPASKTVSLGTDQRDGHEDTLSPAVPKQSAHSKGRFSDMRNRERSVGEIVSPLLDEVFFFNGIIRAALFSGKKGAATATFREMESVGLDGDSETLSLLSVLYSDLNHYEKAQEVFAALEARGEAPSPAAYAAMIRAAGSSENIAAAAKLFKAFEHQFVPDKSAFYRQLSTLLAIETSITTRVTTSALSAARSDAVLAMFQAFRDTGSAEEAFAFRKYLSELYDFKAPRIVFTLMSETCCRAVPQRLDLTQKLCVEVERAELGSVAAEDAQAPVPKELIVESRASKLKKKKRWRNRISSSSAVPATVNLKNDAGQ
jgi:hypothetical protein